MGNYQFTLGDCFDQLANKLTFSGSNGDDGKQLLNDRLAKLKVGGRFLRKAMFGLSNKEVQVALSEDHTTLRWHDVDSGSWLGSIEKGSVDLTKVSSVKAEGTQSLVLTDSSKHEVFNAQAETGNVRDQWVALLTELLESWTETQCRPVAKLSAEGTSEKAAYFQKRQEELEERAKARAEMKSKYSGGGMKYAALALARRGDEEVN
jgi:hypothetical protein